MSKWVLILLLMSLTAMASAQHESLWKSPTEQSNATVQGGISVKKAQLVQLDRAVWESLRTDIPLEEDQPDSDSWAVISLPDPQGKLQLFHICESPVMAPGLADKFPDIRTYLGRGIDDPSAYLRMDHSSEGVHAFVRTSNGTWLISPLHGASPHMHQVYDRRALAGADDLAFDCEIRDEEEPYSTQAESRTAGDDLRVYRLAVAATGEYTAFHGGTVESAMSAIVTAVNRVNSIYEPELGIRLVLVEDNDKIVFTLPNSDPYLDDDSSSDRMHKNQEVIDQRVGKSAYDIGHLFDRRSNSGIASLAAVCSNSRKAKGYTSLLNPSGDLFYVDYVAHEIGHQFAAQHTFNSNSSGSCRGNRASGSAYEPGSGSTIMGYAGLCPGNNYATRSDPYFHGANIEQVARFVTRSLGSACAEVIPTENTPPQADAGGDFFVIPHSTPFELTGSGSDPDGDLLTYCWEEFDLGEPRNLGEISASAPLFRSMPPTNDPVRVFPNIRSILGNIESPEEIIPTIGRDMEFRLTVRDNGTGGGATDWDEIKLRVSGESGPFRVISQNLPETWTAGSFQLISWDRAGTATGEVNTLTVDIYLSAEGGIAYDRLLAENVPNNGRAIISVPEDEEGLDYRIKVKGHNNVFFDVNDAPIRIVRPEVPGIALSVLEDSVVLCGGEPLDIRLGLASIMAYDEEIVLVAEQLPGGLSFVPDSATWRPPAFPQAKVEGTERLPTGTYRFNILATDGRVSDTISISFQVFAGTAAPPDLLQPSPDELDISTQPVFDWGPADDAESYLLEISADPDFSDVIVRDSGLLESAYALPFSLADSTTYYWRVRGDNSSCGPGEFAPASAFTTEVHRCEVFLPRETFPLTINGSTFLATRVNIEKDIIVRDVNVLDIRGQYDDRIGDLEFQLRSAIGPSIDLVPNFENCSARDSFHFELDTEAEQLISCPFQNGARYRPLEPLSIFNGQQARGLWRLTILDPGRRGRLDSWALEICYPVQPLGVSGPGGGKTGRLRVYPNPTSGDIQAEIALERSERVVIEISSMQGATLVRKDLGRFPAGERRFRIQLDELPAGMYVYRWWGQGQILQASGKLVKF